MAETDPYVRVTAGRVELCLFEKQLRGSGHFLTIEVQDPVQLARQLLNTMETWLNDSPVRLHMVGDTKSERNDEEDMDNP